MRTVAAFLPLAVVAAAQSPAAAAAAGGSHHFRMWRVTRTATAALPLDMEVTSTSTGPHAMTLVFGVRGRGSTRTETFAIFSELGHPYPHVYGVNGLGYSPCPSGPGCGSGGGTVQRFPVDTDGRPVRDEYLIVTENAVASVTFRKSGWRVKEVASTTVHRVMAADTTATGAQALGRSVEDYRGASAPGGRYGSFALAFLPCGSVGTGTAELYATPRDKRDKQHLMRCGTPDVAAAASRPAKVIWHVDGSSRGAADSTTRLLVVDLPKS